MRVWKYGDDINTDVLFPGKYTYTCGTAEEIKPHLLEDLDPEFAKTVQPRRHRNGRPELRLRQFAGTARAGYEGGRHPSDCRWGLCPHLLSRGNQPGTAAHRVPGSRARVPEPGDEVTLNPEQGEITVAGRKFSFPSLPPEILAIRDAGGLLAYTRKRLKAKRC